LGGVILGVTFLNEQLTWQVIAGALLILASLAIANMKSKTKELPAAAEARAAAD
jgi:drug/metabolite transporter (DMT)-like permease